eukprot:jgi/Galph1/3097/GphlegSOOS_G1789.1
MSNDAADFEFRTHPSFVHILKKIAGTCRNFFLEKSKLVSFRLPLTRALLRGQLFIAFDTYPRSFKQVAFYSSNSPVSNICEAMLAFFQGTSVTDPFLFYSKGHPLDFLYIELDPYLSPDAWYFLLKRFEVLAFLKSFAMKSRFISNEQLLRLFGLLNKLSTKIIYAFLDNQWFRKDFSNVLQFCQEKKTKSEFREFSLRLQSVNDRSFTRVWKTSLTSITINSFEFGDNGAKYLSEALRENTTLTSLEVLDVDIGLFGKQHKAELLNYIKCNILKRDTTNMSDSSAVTISVADSALNLEPQRTTNSVEYLTGLDQTFIVCCDTHLKESTFLFILYMQIVVWKCACSLLLTFFCILHWRVLPVS